MSKNEVRLEATVIEALPNTQFKIQTDDGKELRAYLAGKMKLNRIRVLVGDRVEFVPDTQGTNNRIVFRK